MSEAKTLGRVAYEEWVGDASAGGWDGLNRRFREAWEEAAESVVAAHEARKWRPISEAPTDGKAVLVGCWFRGAWVQKPTRFVRLAMEDGYTNYVELPAAPEADNAGA